jgi:hypothetical protein
MGTGGEGLNQMKRCEAKSVSQSRARLPGYRLASLKHEKTDIDRRERRGQITTVITAACRLSGVVGCVSAMVGS